MLILFDLDDTLLDHSTAMRSAGMKLWERIETPLAREQFLAAWIGAHERQYPRYLAGELSYQGQRRARVRDAIDPTIDDAAADMLFEAYFACYQQAWSLFSDTANCLRCLRGHQLGVVSNGQSHEQRSKLAQTGIADAFSYVLISEESGIAKPAAAIFHKACADLGVRPADALYVGDRYDLDADAARRAGLQGVWLDRKRTRTAESRPPIINSLEELPALVASLD